MDDARTVVVRTPTRSVRVVATTGLVLVVALEGLRVFFPVVYTYRESSGLTKAAVIGVGVFVAPVLAPLLVRLAGRGRALVGVVVLLAVLRVVLQASSSFGITLAALTAGVGLVALGVVLLVVGEFGAELAVGVVAGLALDTVLRVAWSTWDLVWQDGIGAWLVIAALVVGMVAAAALMARDAPRGRVAPVLSAALALGPFLALQVLVLQNPAFVSSSGNAALATASTVVLFGDVIALGAVALVLARRVSTTVAASAAVALVPLMWWATGATGLGIVAVVLAGQFLAALLVARVLVVSEPARASHAALDALGLGAGSLVFGLLVIGYQLHYDRPLPVSNRWLPVVAAMLLGAISLVTRRMPAGDRIRDDERRRGLRTVSLAAATIAGVGIVLFGALALGEPDLAPAITRPHDLTVMTYNVHETVSRNGHLDPGAFARAVRRQHPDVLVVQEAARGWPLSGGIDLAEWGKRELGLPYVWVPAADHQFGNVVFSQVPVRSAEIIDLPHATGRMKRSAVVARVGPVAGRIVTVIGTHLQEGEAPDRVQARIDELHTILRAAGDGVRTVITGDLNSDPASPELQVLLDAGYRTTQPTQTCTLKTSNRNCVDWILVGPDLAQDKVRAVPTDTFDHRPLVSTIHTEG